MAKTTKQRGLGRGLSALMADVTEDTVAAPQGAPTRPDLMVPIEKVSPNPDQPRRHFADEALQELAAYLFRKKPFFLYDQTINRE